MFVADARLSVSILVLVLIVWALAARLSPLLAGGVLVFGCLAVLVSTVAHEGARKGPPMNGSLKDHALSKVPEVTLAFWIIKIAATTLGETGGDSVTMTLLHADKNAHNGGYLIGTALFFAILVALVIWQIARQAVPSLSLLGDDRRLDDLRHDDGRFCRSLARHRLHRRLVAAARPASWPASACGTGRKGTISVNTVATPRVEAFYWAAITFSQTLGTALGDWMADTGGLGYEGGALVFLAAARRPRRALLLEQRVPGAAVLGRVHPDPAARRDGRGFPRQAPSVMAALR